ncbi:WecB/TagA/CpsF family glycosyltransferase [Ethanoligenens harbinense]|uniref:Glycosyl transferase, WecB/TagA/CpsF family n=1 Tax=Ethanoligenens harbinense (strain DSM 18485 / JCM 12961 / CGMCC 1.5033 / YUAN-3) TaxID=663278 RepID=E6U7I9_ETHHY|nr:WecB/TagA/CpsF family glycosyltransferase [Ethanoligenens harbinense]ADU27012.1 glycosyl transferase, WecB/TagA/CpsF family [Ethanoligenens harbinense YUAN-3]AVQ96099.1 glycosyltransferase [Ethanoligenens harbinense YUAN-3]AYF38760.1 glycosyltransferase [Ethanoligenens harbinense]AYF41508.1 glycosyltransferase [Ethanoligenens harbinense]QCN92340.1 glycosyltransferase [Ethanoligenens harbinense]
MPKTRVLGIAYENVTLAEAVRDVLALAQADGTAYVVTPNPEISEACVENERLARAVAGADYVLPDGIGVIMAAKIGGTPLKERVGGFDLATALLPELERRGLRLFLLGAKPGVAEKAAENIHARFPALCITGTHDGYFRDDAQAVAAVNAAGADVVFVALGFPRQEIFMQDNREALQAHILLGLGGGLDVFAGITKRAPDLFIRMNMEWFYRLLCQPWRFMRMLKLPKYIFRAIGARFFEKKA